MIMNAEYLQLFEQLVREVVRTQGLCLPWELQQYTTAVMAEYTDQPDPTLGKTFAELYLTAETALDCKTVGDAALLVYGAFPQYRQHRGVHRRYYSEIGRSAYSRIPRQPFHMMSEHFDLAGDLVQATVTQLPVQMLR
jgi:hypothetical protein